MAREIIARKKEQTNVLKKEAAELQKQLKELQKKDQITVLIKRVAELQAQLTEAKSFTTTAPARNTAPQRATTGSTEQRPIELIPPERRYLLGMLSSRTSALGLPKLSNAEKRELDRRKIKYRGRPIPSLVDTGCDVTIAGNALAKKHHWKIRPADLQSVKAANNEHMLIEGIANVSLAISKRSVWHEIHITPHLDELILESDSMVKQGRLTWDYANEQVSFGDGNKWIPLHRELVVGCRCVIVETSTVLPPR